VTAPTQNLFTRFDCPPLPIVVELELGIGLYNFMDTVWQRRTSSDSPYLQRLVEGLEAVEEVCRSLLSLKMRIIYPCSLRAFKRSEQSYRPCKIES
jgi:hypothetical protein